MNSKYTYLVLLLCCFSFKGWAQQKRNINTNWEKEITKPDNKSSRSNVGFNQTNNVPKASAFHRINLEDIELNEVWVDRALADANSLTISNIRYQNLNSEELKELNKDAVVETFTAKIESSYARDIIYTSLSYSPVVKTGNTYQKVTSFSIDYDYKQSPFSNRGTSNYNQEVHSIFATGNWYKFEVDKTGIYKIDGKFLSDLGINLNNVNPNKIKIYGHGGDALPLKNSENAAIDPPQTPIKVFSQSQSNFGRDDYILFFAQGTRTYNQENDSHINPYADKSFYYVTVEGEDGERIQPMNEPSGSVNHIINSYHRAQFHEVDAFSPAKVGRRWFGNRFDIQSTQEYNFEFPNRVPGSEVQVIIKTGAVSNSHTDMDILINQTESHRLSYSPINDPTFLVTRDYNKTITPNNNTINIKMQYRNNGNPSSTAYLDYIRVIASESLTASNKQQFFENLDTQLLGGILEYQLSQAQSVKEIWDVTDPQNIQFKTNNNAPSISWRTTGTQVRQYVSVVESDFYSPTMANQAQVRNQNIKGRIFRNAQGEFEDIDYLIITSESLKSPAERLAQHHRNRNNLNTIVLSTEEIYEEFSSGKQDISAIRNLVRYVYNNASSPEKRIKYLALFGDTSVDYKDRWEDNNNIVPSFHTLSSISNFSSYVSDDFFGMMDENEGSMIASDKLDIAVGRILADEIGLAQAMVTKIINYQNEVSYGDWRNNIITISDDVDKTYEFESIQNVLNQLSDDISDYTPNFNVKKILTDSYVQQTSAGGNRYPEVNKAITDAIEVGGLIVNYFGHGGEDGLAHEYIYTQNNARNLNNNNRFPLFITVTCEFTKFDYPLRITAGELTYWNREGGAVSLITTTRAISVSLGVEYNIIMTPELLGYNTDEPIIPAEALRITKNQLGDQFRRVVFYIGDPAMELAKAEPNVELTHINDIEVGHADEPVIQALGKVKLSGEVNDSQGNLIDNYKGIINVKVFDKNIERSTLANDGTTDSEGNLLILDFTTLGEIIFNGQASVENGKFDLEFIAPKDIKSEVGSGRVNFYTKRDGVLEDRSGHNNNIQIGGINPNAAEDNKGPEIELYFDNESFTSGGSTNTKPLLIAKLYDESGINTSSGIGHDIIAYIDGEETNAIKLNEYYQAEVDDFTRGALQYQLKDLEAGLHTLTLKAWDVYNNSSTKSIDFVVNESNKLEIKRLLNYPNPFVSHTEFWFEHNRPMEPLEVQVQVLSVSGKIVWSTQRLITTEGNLSREITWDGRDDFGDKIGKGVYIYKISLKSTLTNQSVEKFEKLVIL